MRLTCLCLLISAPVLFAQAGRLTLEAVAHPTLQAHLAGSPSAKFEWLPDGALVQAEREAGRATFLRRAPGSWKPSPWVEVPALEAALVAAGAPQAPARKALEQGDFTWKADHGAFLVEVAEDLFLVDPAKAQARRLTAQPGEEDEPSFSPDGRQVAFLRGNDLFRIDLATGAETRLTTGGDETHLHGRLDWVYQEEVYGRGTFRAYWWSPDSRHLAYLSLDESKVPVYRLEDDRPLAQRTLRARYPRAGEPNPVARLGVADLEGRTTWMDDPYPGQETLIVQVGWDPQGRLLASYQDRIQRWLDLRRFEGTASKPLIHEQGPTWQERLPLPVFLKDGGFLWESDRTGYHHLYRYAADGNLIGALTSGTWDVRQLLGVDPGGRAVYFEGTARSPIDQDAYRVGLDGKGLTRLTERPGTHAVLFNPTFTAFVDTWSDIHTPPQSVLRAEDGRQIAVLQANPAEAWKALTKGQITFQRVMTRDGVPMESLLVKPVGFDPTRKYPVFQSIYGGPLTPSVRNLWLPQMPWFQFLANHGIAVWVCDNRSASNQGPASAWGIYRNLGAQELRDQLDGLAWLKAQGWADMDRICLSGWSYGGFMTSYALTHSGAWKLGLVGAPVTDWHLYDSIYTERYMGLPADNREGYEASSVLKAAAHLHGRLLLLHGTLDDNVHPQNTIEFLDALQHANLPTPPLILLPGSDHSPRAPQHRWAVLQAMWAFLEQNL